MRLFWALCSLVLLAPGVLALWGCHCENDASMPSGDFIPSASGDATSDTCGSETGHVNVIDATGAVEAKSGDQWFSVQVGDTIERFESIRTGAHGVAVLDLGKHAKVTVQAQSQLSMEPAEGSKLRVRLDKGRLSAVVDPTATTTLQVSAKGSDTIATADGGEFAMQSDGKGEVTVAGLQGTVMVRAKQKTVTLGAGTLSVVRPSLPPAPPVAIPPSLFLKVGKPRSLVQREKTATVRGKTTPGSLVWVNNIQVRAGANGEFRAVISLREGGNKIVVKSEDVVGRTRTATMQKITVDSKAPRAASKVTW